VFSEFVAQDEIIMDENVTQVEDCQNHEEQEYENDDPIQELFTQCHRTYANYGPV